MPACLLAIHVDTAALIKGRVNLEQNECKCQFYHQSHNYETQVDYIKTAGRQSST